MSFLLRGSGRNANANAAAATAAATAAANAAANAAAANAQQQHNNASASPSAEESQGGKKVRFPMTMTVSRMVPLQPRDTQTHRHTDNDHMTI